MQHKPAADCEVHEQGILSTSDWSPIGVLALWRGSQLLAKPPGASVILPRTPELVDALRPKEASRGLWTKLKAGRRESSVPVEVLAAIEKPLHIAEARLKYIAEELKKPVATVKDSSLKAVETAVADPKESVALASREAMKPSPILLATSLAAAALVIAAAIACLARLRVAEGDMALLRCCFLH